MLYSTLYYTIKLSPLHLNNLLSGQFLQLCSIYKTIWIWPGSFKLLHKNFNIMQVIFGPFTPSVWDPPPLSGKGKVGVTVEVQLIQLLIVNTYCLPISRCVAVFYKLNMCLIPRHNVTMVTVHVVIFYELLYIGFCVQLLFTS